MDEIISRLNEEGYLVSKDFISNIPKNFDVVGFLNLLKNKIKDNKEITVLNKDILLSVLKDKKTIELNWGEFDESKALLEKGKDGEMYQTFVDLLNYEASKKKLEKIMGSVGIEEEIELLEEEKTESNVIILKSHKEEAQKRSVDDFTNHFRKRFEILSNILKTRQELKEVISLNRLNGKKDHERICVIGMIIEKRVTKNDNILIRIEDFTGEIVAIINKNNSKIFLEAKDLCDDEIIGLLGPKNGDIIYAVETPDSGKSILWRSQDKGATWSNLGTNPFSRVEEIIISANDPNILYAAAWNGVYKFNGSSWQAVGSAGLSEGGVRHLTMDISSNRIYIAFLERDMVDRITVKMWDGSFWITVGTRAFSAQNQRYPSIAVNGGVPHIAFSDSENANKITVMRLR